MRVVNFSSSCTKVRFHVKSTVFKCIVAVSCYVSKERSTRRQDYNIRTHPSPYVGFVHYVIWQCLILYYYKDIPGSFYRISLSL